LFAESQYQRGSPAMHRQQASWMRVVAIHTFGF